MFFQELNYNLLDNFYSIIFHHIHDDSNVITFIYKHIMINDFVVLIQLAFSLYSFTNTTLFCKIL